MSRTCMLSYYHLKSHILLTGGLCTPLYSSSSWKATHWTGDKFTIHVYMWKWMDTGQ